MEHFQTPTNRCVLEHPSLVGKGSLGGYQPFVTHYLRIDSGRIVNAVFQAEGCGVTVAGGSILTELIKGRELTECRALTAQDISKSLDGIPQGKEYCADVTIAALRDALRNWQ
jgi:NifU-like protein involved in Fe-S cluster formation